GACLYSGTIPSKTFREAVMDLTRFYERHFEGKDAITPDVTIDELNFRLNTVIREERNIIARQFKKNGILFVEGQARFENKNTIIVVDQEHRIKFQINASIYVIATGSNPRNPPDVPFDEEVILDSTTLLGIGRVPKSMIVLGGGIIGSEYASFFAALGTEVTVIDRKEHMLPMLDAEIGIHLQTALTDIGLKFIGKKEPVEIARINDHAYVKFKDGSSLEAEVLLYALGRTANVASLRLENTGIVVDPKGYIPVNALFQTIVPNIYAVGDVIGGPSLASTSMEQGRLAALHACGVQTHHFPTFFPIGIYTIPEISCCGYTEEELKSWGYRYEVGRAHFYEIAKSHIVGTTTGLFKILFHAETLEILGVHIIGRNATEVIHIGQMAISFHAHLDYFIDHVFNYPTYAEGYRIAALNGINKIKSRKV
ncbi:MAG: Si-specific NAD(P)(+) transhydrogenase, partial [Parachlamydiaceae bacterium]|nr:Si-specific NAD(P)(+) transhydrogenase [Parachlamydiaceae bacterium]